MYRGSAVDIRPRVEQWFGAWGRFVCRQRWAIIALSLLVSGALIAQLPNLTVDNSTDGFLHADDPIRLQYDAFRLEFGRDALITVAIEAPDVFEAGFLRRLAVFHEDLERAVPFVEDMTSLVNARNTRGEGDELIVEELLERWPRGHEDLAALRERVLSNPLYRNTLVSEDATLTTLTIQLYAFRPEAEETLAGFEDDEDAREGEGADAELPYLPEPEASAAVRAVREVMRRHDAPGFRTWLAGGPVMSERLNAGMTADIQRFSLASLVCIGALLYLLFRRADAVVLPIVVVTLATLSTLGLIAATGTPLSVGTQILPSTLLAVGVCDGIHILAIYYRRLEVGDSVEDAICYSLSHSGLAVVMTSLTTAGGLASFAAADLAPVAQLGVFAPIGVMWALVYSVALLPALLAVLHARVSPRRADPGGDRLDRVLQRMGAFAAERAVPVAVVSGAILVVALLGASRLAFTHDTLAWFSEGDPLREATLLMDDRLDGVANIEILVDTGEEDGLYEPQRLDQLEEIHRYAQTISSGDFHVSKTISLVDIVKEIHQALNQNDPAHYLVPRDRALVAQEMLLFENTGSDDLADFVDTPFRTARMTMRVPWTDAAHYPELLENLEAGLETIASGADVETTGLLVILARTFVGVNRSMARSFCIAVLVITPLMVLLIGDLRLGLLSMIPNLAPVVIMLGAMGWIGMGIDATTMMVGATVIGLAVDDTIHFMHNFSRYHAGGDARKAIEATLATTGRALLVTSLVLSAGFLTFTAASMRNMFYFGLLTSLTISLAFVSNVLLGSAIVVLATRGRGR